MPPPAKIPSPEKFCNQQNLVVRVEQRQNQKNLPIDAKIGLDKRKRKYAMVRQEFATDKIWHQDKI
jgi:hypothetical protein